MVIWQIWLARNSLIFENHTPSNNSIAFRSLGMHQLWRDIHPTKEKKKKLLTHTLPTTTTKVGSMVHPNTLVRCVVQGD
jgi:hypothetical protein